MVNVTIVLVKVTDTNVLVTFTNRLVTKLCVPFFTNL